MAGTAYRFRPGHRIRLQVSSGAHPLYARNLGTGEPPTTATTMRAADQEVFHDAEHARPWRCRSCDLSGLDGRGLRDRCEVGTKLGRRAARKSPEITVTADDGWRNEAR